MKIDVDTSALSDALRLYARAREDKSYPYICNRALQNCAGRAIQYTIAADANKIAWQMGQVETRFATKSKKSPTGYRFLKKPRRIFQYKDTLATRLVNAIRVKKGLKPIWGQELETAARKLIGFRLRSVGFLRSGWLPAFVGLSRRLDKPLRLQSLPRRYKQAKGRYEAARRGAVTDAEAFNTANEVIPHGVPGAAKAVEFVARDMTEWALRKLVEQARQSGLSARVL